MCAAFRSGYYSLCQNPVPIPRKEGGGLGGVRSISPVINIADFTKKDKGILKTKLWRCYIQHRLKVAQLLPTNQQNISEKKNTVLQFAEVMSHKTNRSLSYSFSSVAQITQQKKNPKSTLGANSTTESFVANIIIL